MHNVQPLSTVSRTIVSLYNCLVLCHRMWNEYEGELCTFSVLVWLSNVTWVSAAGDIILGERKTSKAGGTVGGALPR